MHHEVISSTIQLSSTDISVIVQDVVLLTIAAVAREEHIALSPLREVKSEWLKFPSQNKQADFAIMATLFQGIKSDVDALNAIGASSPSHSISLIGRESCLQFTDFSFDSSAMIIECLSDDHPPEFLDFVVENYGSGFGQDEQKFRATLSIVDEFAEGWTWENHFVHYASVGSSNSRQSRIMKAHDPVAKCSYWVLVAYNSNFHVGPDTLIWSKSSKGWFGLNSKQETLIERIPHSFSVDDVAILKNLFEVLSTALLAHVLNIPFVWPKFPGCGTSATKDLVPMEAHPLQAPTDWFWASSRWGKCSARCNGVRFRLVVCVSNTFIVDPSEARCAASSKPAITDHCHRLVPECVF